MSVAEALAQPDIPGVDMDFEFDPPRAFIGLLRGENFGKLQVKLGAEPQGL